MRTGTSTVAFVVSGMLIVGTAFAQTAAGGASGSSSGGGGAGSGAPTQGGSTKQDANNKARGRADAGQPGQGERDSSGKDASLGSASVGTQDRTKQIVMQVQQALKDKGKDPGAIDGVMGAKTRSALKAYQEEHGMEATGRLDAKTMAGLGVDGQPTESGASKWPDTGSSKAGRSGS